MIHPRMSKKKLIKMISVFKTLAACEKQDNFSGSIVDDRQYRQQKERYQNILEKLENGMDTKIYPFDKDEARELVVGLDLYNVIITDNKIRHWDLDVENLYHEFKKRFSEMYNETLYESESSDISK